MSKHFQTLEKIIIANREGRPLTLETDELSNVMRMIGHGHRTMTSVAEAVDYWWAETPLVDPGDRVLDPVDRTWRTVVRVQDATVFMEDGGCMGLEECTVIRLPSE